MSNDINDVLGVSTPKHADASQQGFAKKYPALRTLSGVIAVIAWIAALATLIIVLALLSNARGEGSWIIPVATLIVGTLIFIGLLAYAEIIKVFVDIEENTRMAATK